MLQCRAHCILIPAEGPDRQEPLQLQEDFAIACDTFTAGHDSLLCHLWSKCHLKWRQGDRKRDCEFHKVTDSPESRGKRKPARGTKAPPAKLPGWGNPIKLEDCHSWQRVFNNCKGDIIIGSYHSNLKACQLQGKHQINGQIPFVCVCVRDHLHQQ